MFDCNSLSFNTTGGINRLVSDYLNKHEDTKHLYHHYPDLQGFKNFIGAQAYEKMDRQLLFNIVSNQNNTLIELSAKTKNNISALQSQNTYTVTTGHQLCLFTGPLYFVYKILSTLKLCETLHQTFPEQNFVPVYWMASEDHDFEEVNHLHLYGKKIQWSSNQSGAVGDFQTEGLSAIMEEFQSIVGAGAEAEKLKDLFEAAYLKHHNLADATRYLVNALFGEKGLVIVDGNDAAFKKQFIPYFEKDIFDHLAYETVSPATKNLTKKNYTVQVNPREINCFYLGQQSRNRIENANDAFGLHGLEQKFTATELRKIIHDTPEKISPNVVLRPVYQQVILPNIAYVGGPGELAYWLEFKAMFDAFDVRFPILVPRNFFSVVDKGMKTKMEKLNLHLEDFFKDEKSIVDLFQKNSNAVFDIGSEVKAMESIFNTLIEKLNAVDKTLSGSASAELQKDINGLKAIEAKANKSLKQKSETEINQIKTIKQKLFPENIPQERFDNFAPYIIKYGFDFINQVYDCLDPLDFKHRVLVEKNT